MNQRRVHQSFVRPLWNYVSVPFDEHVFILVILLKLESSSSSDETNQKFKPTSLPDTLAFELQSKVTPDSDNSLDTQKPSYAIMDDERYLPALSLDLTVFSNSENGIRSSPLSSRPHAKHLSRNLFGESKKTELLSVSSIIT